MFLILIGILFPLILLATMTFNIYVLISLFAKEHDRDKPFKVGLSVIFGLVFTIMIMKGHVFNTSPIVVLIYGSFTGLLFGIYKESKRVKRQSISPFPLTTPGVINRPSFNVKMWLNSTLRLLTFVLLGLMATYGLIFVLALLFSKSFFVR